MNCDLSSDKSSFAEYDCDIWTSQDSETKAGREGLHVTGRSKRWGISTLVPAARIIEQSLGCQKRRGILASEEE